MATSTPFPQPNFVPPQNQQTDQSLPIKEEKQIRSVFVGNIPYEANEEELRTIFSRIGPVLTFRIMYDRETGKPKGYGFCEFRDVETAQSAIRNLNGLDLHNRTLRVDSAVNEKGKDEIKEPKTIEIPTIVNTIQTEYKAEDISKIISSMPIEQTYELINQMKICVQHNPDECREMLIQNPQLGYALLHALLLLKIIDPNMAQELLLKRPPQLNPNIPTTVKIQPPSMPLYPMHTAPPFRDDLLPSEMGMPLPDRHMPQDFKNYPMRAPPPLYPESNSEHSLHSKSYIKQDLPLPSDIKYMSPVEYQDREYRGDLQKARKTRDEMAGYFEEDSLRDNFSNIIPPQVSQFKSDYNYNHNYERDRYSSPHEYQSRDNNNPPRSPHLDPRVNLREKESRQSQRSLSPRDSHTYSDNRESRHLKPSIQVPSDPRIQAQKGNPSDEAMYMRDRDRDNREYVRPPSHAGERQTRYPASRYSSNDRNTKY